ncbi:DUF4429 domain-containing protein [Streptomyces sp. NPDC054949]|uniref:DUF4429 domain-containing protein n=1 Tax=unclassified Streptomyces TaxID=2593676 RepID=UPI0006B0425E|nr:MULTISPECIES: DUF4429 domain-containing protein [unclassified Streptomyces]KOU68309.1 Tat pathway signal sequence domain protein [Streptomyces sp. WM4235]MCX5075284.1 DUF4429 domain-containing protein [Streptomyces sp. NBC_00424]MCX5153100.1 DUF4429 domain-containing protein [Streptomyces sp. NBC_00291]WUD41589.1 DUF4429 domain-containing protein [Streptomyces sp. NBC_00513]
MAEIIQKDGTWTFEGDAVRIVPGRDKEVGPLRQALGELLVPLGAIGGVSYEPGRKSGRLRLRPRDGADPLLQVTGGRLPETSDPYRLTVESDRTGVAEYFVDEIRNALLLDQVDPGPSDRYLLPGPAVPITASGGDGTVSFDGDRITLDWNWTAEEAKQSAGSRQFRVADLRGVEWAPSRGLSNGVLRFTPAGAQAPPSPKYDPYALELFGTGRKELATALVAAAVAARLPHPAAALAPAPAALPADGADHDALLRRLRELGELHTSGVLTAEEFSTAKAAILRRF